MAAFTMMGPLGCDSLHPAHLLSAGIGEVLAAYHNTSHKLRRPSYILQGPPTLKLREVTRKLLHRTSALRKEPSPVGSFELFSLNKSRKIRFPGDPVWSPPSPSFTQTLQL